jgi:NADPH-dependent 2,4-dienoyl-CoA reductase/sulfur reductase-like enzyme
MGRLRFAFEIIDRVRAKCGADFPVGFRVSCDEMVNGGLVPDDVEIICRMLAEAGVDALSVSRGNYQSLPYNVPPHATPIAPLASFSQRVKRIVDIPVIVAQRIHDPIVAEHIIAQEKADLVGMGRALIADPELPNKAAAGHFEDVKPCIACNQGCMERRVGLRLPMSCMVNPTVGREKEMALVPVQRSKKVLVAGGGPAGLEAARVSALRGHQVMLCEKTDKLGGQFGLAVVPPTKQEFAKVIQYLSTQVKKAGGTIDLGREVTPELVDELKPDVVIVATGGAPFIPESIPGANKPNVVTANDILAGKVIVGNKVVIIGGGEVGCEIADYVGERGVRQIIVVEMLKGVALDMFFINKKFLMDRLNAYGVSVVTSAKVKEIIDDGVIFSKNGRDEYIRNVDNVILAMGVKPVNNLLAKIRHKVADVYVIGDAKEPRKAIDAIAEGAEIAGRI